MPELQTNYGSFLYKNENQDKLNKTGFVVIDYLVDW